MQNQTYKAPIYNGQMNQGLCIKKNKGRIIMELICGTSTYQLDTIIDEYSTLLYHVAMVRMQNKEDAEDIVQDAFLRLLQQIQKGKTFESKEHLKAWLLTVVTNRGKSILTLAWNKRTQGLDSAMEIAAPEKDTDYAYEYVMRLPEKYRVAIDLFYYQELTTEQIAQIMKTKPTTVRSYLHRGRQKLKEMMGVDA